MIATWKQYEGQAVDGIPLLRLLGGSDAGAVFLGELAGTPCAIKLAPAEDAVAQIPLARWQQASKLSHPNLVKIHQWGRAHLDGASFVYLAMEHAEEELASVDRPLTPKEAREMLAPAVSALEYLHSQKFAHGRIRPSNILSVNEVLKISGDAPLRFGERHPARSAPSPYDAPELANAGVTASGDVWSLGVTLVEALTKELPNVEGDSPRLPASLKPDSFRAVAAGCLQRDPARRWTIADLAQWLERGTMPAPKKAPRRYWLPVGVAAGLVIAGVIVRPHLTGTSASSSPSAAGSPAPVTAAAAATAQQAPPREALPEPAPPPVTPTHERPAKAAKKSRPPAQQVAAAVAPSSAPSQPPEAPAKQTAATSPSPSPSPSDAIPDGVVQPVKPDVPSKARLTIHGKVPIFIRVETDASGAVSAATVESGGSSKYFADLSLKAAKQWKFAAAGAETAWLIKFEFTRDAEHPVSMQASRMK